MKAQELAIVEMRGITAFLASFLFIRLVKIEKGPKKGIYMIRPVPPWRALRVNDIFDKETTKIG